jgi:hypothetical protein
MFVYVVLCLMFYARDRYMFPVLFGRVAGVFGCFFVRFPVLQSAPFMFLRSRFLVAAFFVFQAIY